MKKHVSDEEVAFKLVSIYFEEIARLGFKRSLDLDAIINAYFYTLQRLKDKDKMIKEMAQQVLEEERKLATQSKEEMIPSMPEKMMQVEKPTPATSKPITPLNEEPH